MQVVKQAPPQRCSRTMPTLARYAACAAAAVGPCAFGVFACGGPAATSNPDAGPIVVHGNPYGDSGCDPTLAPKDESCVLADAYGVFVAPVSSRGDDENGDGSMAHPFATIGKALSTGSSNVFVCNGTYSENVSVAAPVRLYAGLSCASDGGGAAWSYAGGVATVSAPTGGSPALKIVDAGDAGISIADLAVMAPDQSPSGWDPSTGDGTSSIAALIANSTVTLTRVTLAAGAGSNGAAGADGVTMMNYPLLADGGADPAPQGTSGLCLLAIEAGASGAGGASMVCTNGTTSLGGSGGTVSPAPPYAASSGTSGAPAVPGFAGGGAGGSLGDASDSSDLDAACLGASGANGLAAAPGAPPVAYGALSIAGWTPSAGGSGQAGGTGQGGGGGSGSASTALFAAAPEPCGGSGGSAGGCGGAGGTGGRGGGASIALASVGSVVVLVACSLHASQGGNGGAGGAGQNGQGGGPSLDENEATLIVCGGGAGGNGAGGSGGAGGTGGLSAGIVFTGSPPSFDSTTVIVPGVEGLAGQPGAGGVHGVNPNRGGITTGNDGGEGAPGLSGAPTLVLGL
jgi:hypothetical protein